MPDRRDLDSLPAIADAAVKIHGLLKEILNDSKSAIRDRRLRKICGALRKIFFTPDGVLTLLSAAGQGSEVTREEYEQHFAKFREADKQVRAALEYLDDGNVLHDLGLPMRDSELLMQIRYGKLRLRDSILKQFPSYEMLIDKRNRVSARHFSGAVRALNDLLIEIESRLNPLTEEH
jgi:hypothetical protein